MAAAAAAIAGPLAVRGTSVGTELDPVTYIRLVRSAIHEGQLQGAASWPLQVPHEQPTAGSTWVSQSSQLCSALSIACGLGVRGGAAAFRRRRRGMGMEVAVLARTWRVRSRRQAEPPGKEGSLTQEQEVLRRLRSIMDKGLGADIVACGFAGDVEVDPTKGHVSFRLEVAAFEDIARKEVEKLPWVKSVEIRAPAAAPPGPKPGTQQMPPQRPMPKMPPSLEKVKSIIAVSSCKGGVGKSTVAVNLAFELRKRGLEVGIFDCDVYGPSLPVMVRLDEPPQMTMYEDEEKQKHIVPVVHEESGIKLVSFGYAGKAAVMRGSMVTGVIAQLMTQTEWGDLDYLILDLPPGTGDIHLTLAQVCRITAAVIVTTPQKLSTIDVERGISMFSQLAVPSVAVMQNMSYVALPGGQRQYPFGNTAAGREIADTFGIDHVFEMPLDPVVSQAGDGGQPFVLNSDDAAATEIGRLATAVEQEVKKIHAGAKRPVVTFNEEENCLEVKLPDGEAFSLDPLVLRLRDKGAGGGKAPLPGAKPVELQDMGNYAVVVRWSDGFVQVAPHKQLIYGDEKGPMPRIQVADKTPA